MEREQASDRVSERASQRAWPQRTVTVYYAIFLSPATYTHLRSRLHHRGSKVLLLVHRCALVFLFILACPFVVRSLVGSVGRSVRRSDGRRLVRPVRSVVGFFVRGLRAPNESWPVIIRSCYLPGHLAALHLRADYPGNLLR